MKKVYLTLLSTILAIMLMASCNQGNNPGSGKDPINPSKISNPWGKSWFAGNAEYQFVSTEKGKFIRYLPDTLNTSYYFEVTEEIENTVAVKALYSSASIRQVGQVSSFDWEIKKDLLCLSSDNSLFNINNLQTFEGTDPAEFNVPDIKTEYLSNFDGEYTLKKSGCKLQIKSKIFIEQDVNHSWAAHVVDVQEKDDVYDLLLCHTSNADTGITGKEPFITSQATVWSHMVFTPAENDTTKVEWSNVWASTPAEALALSLNESDTFDFVIKGITYSYEFYFGNPAQVGGFWNVEKGEKIGSFTKTSKTPINWTWKTLLEEANLSITIPEGKQKAGWWFLTGTLYAMKDSAVYSLKDSTGIDYKEQTFYLELEDKADENDIYLRDGKYVFNTSWIIEIDSANKTISYKGCDTSGNNYSKDFIVTASKTYSTVTGTDKPFNVMYFVKDSEDNLYYFKIVYYINNGSADYIKTCQVPYESLSAEEDFRENFVDYVFTTANKLKNYTVQGN